MSQTETEQRTIFGESLDEQLRIETTGRVIRPWKRMLDKIADEYKLRCSPDGLHVQCLDTSKVKMITTTLSAGAFESYTTEGTTLGINAERFGSALRHARYGATTDDTVVLSADSGYLQTVVNREIGGTSAEITERMELIDPKSIRQEPDNPDLELEVDVSMSPDAFIEAARMFDDDGHIKIKSDSGELLLAQENDLEQRQVALDVGTSVETGWTIYTGQYIVEFAQALNNGLVDNLTLRWKDDYPLKLDFEREGIYKGTLMVAPRVQPDDRP